MREGLIYCYNPSGASLLETHADTVGPLAGVGRIAGGQSQEGLPGTPGSDSAFCSCSYTSWTRLAENKCYVTSMSSCACQSCQGLALPSLPIAGTVVQLPGVTCYGGDMSKWSCLTPSVLLTTSQGNWMHTNFSLFFLQTDPQEASATLRPTMFCFNLTM